MKVTMLLADSAQAVEGKLYILGGGWSIAGPDPVPSAIALLIQVPWNQANVRHTFELMLLDADGQDEPQPVRVEGEFEQDARLACNLAHLSTQLRQSTSHLCPCLRVGATCGS